MKKLLTQITNPVIGDEGNIGSGNPLAAQIARLWKTMVIAGALAAILYLAWGAFDWTTSEGNQEKLTAARNKMIHAVAGLAFLAASVAIVYFINELKIFGGLNILEITWPTP